MPCILTSAYKPCPSPFGILAMGDKGGGSRVGQEFGTMEIPGKMWYRVWFGKHSYNKIFQKKITANVRARCA